MTPRILPMRAHLLRWEFHCSITHGATPADYRRRVLEWHQETHPECKTGPVFETYNQGNRA